MIPSALLPLWLSACTGGDDSATRHPDLHQDSGGDADADADADSDADSDSDTDTDALCSENPPTTPPGDTCVTSAIACGQTIEATPAGGDSDWTGADYTAAFCFPNLDRHDYAGPERIYALDVPANTTATVTLEAPCADMDLAVVRWEQDTCPGDADPLTTCEGSDAEGDDQVSVSWDRDTRWLVVVDAKNAADEEANFRVSVACE